MSSEELANVADEFLIAGNKKNDEEKIEWEKESNDEIDYTSMNFVSTNSEEEPFEAQVGRFERTLRSANEQVRAYQTQRDACKK